MMRTTLTIDDDVAQELEKMKVATNQSFKAVINDALRAGLLVLKRPKAIRQGESATTPVRLGKSRLASLDNIGEVLALIEGEGYR